MPEDRPWEYDDPVSGPWDQDEPVDAGGPPNAGDYLRSAVTSGAKRSWDTVVGAIKAMNEFRKAGPVTMGGDQPVHEAPAAQLALLKRIAQGEVARVGENVRAAGEAEPGSLEQAKRVTGAAPVVGESLSTMVGGLSGKPEDVGPALAEAVMTIAPLGKLKGEAGVKPHPKLRESRIRSISQATGAGASDIPFIERNLDKLDIPVGTRRRIERLSSESRRQAGEQVGIAEERLAREGGAVDPESITAGMDSGSRSRLYRDPETGKEVVVDVTGDPELARAIEGRAAAMGEQYRGEPVSLSEVVQRKHEAQAVARRAKLYDQTPGGPPISPKAVAAGEEASALKSAIENAAVKGDKAAQNYLRAAEADSLTIAVNEPVLARRNALLAAKGKGSHGLELAGRAATSRELAGSTAAGALAGFGAVKFWNSPLWASLSARIKRHLIGVLETEGFDAFRIETARAAVIESKRRRAAEKALRDAGEGVIE